MSSIYWALLAIVLAGAATRMVARRDHGESQARTSASELGHYLESFDRYVFHVGIPAEAPVAWRRVSSATRLMLTVDRETQLALDSIRAYVVSYPSGELVDYRFAGLTALPDGVHEPEAVERPANDHLTNTMLKRADPAVRVLFGPSSDPRPTEASFRTRVHNTRPESIRVLRFGAYAPLGNGSYRLNTITNGFFTAEQFAEWYGTPDDGWLAPGASAADPSNYGGRDSLWVYWFETKSGNKGFAYGTAAANWETSQE